ncbi:ArsA family ATPase [Labedaea rhizosphaerae]|uniref:Arsenite efflux ATP-binding protein ArsA n=1 Tax=Labedaea rhizosphaerae TaxID=598644 RepID=A0A4R6SAS9_LABRH|nr:ArsA family ATPase [Labedaea rhizosphaerae]TDP96066.1 arsenite efflux ATP-binding protein ArsA [Labedaea rhizosphaerae]
MRILLFTGKGGVGKTTIAAATAARLARDGRKTLVVSTDAAHSLADALDTRLRPDPSEVDSNLFASHVDSRELVDRSWPRLREQARGVLAGLGIDELDAEELTVLPGVDELLALGEVARLAAAGTWDVVIVDCGPTAETLRLLALPEAIARYVDRLFGKRVLREALRTLADHLTELRRVLTDPDVTSVRLVFTPERVVVAETRRTLTALALRGIQVDELIANRLAPKARRWGGPAGAWLRTRRGEQDVVLGQLESSVTAPVRVLEHRAAEPVGSAALLELADELYAEWGPLDGPGGERVPLLDVQRTGDGYLLRIALPLPDDSALNLARVGDELAITVDGLRRLIALPAALRRYEVVDAEASQAGLVLRLRPEVTA